MLLHTRPPLCTTGLSSPLGRSSIGKFLIATLVLSSLSPLIAANNPATGSKNAAADLAKAVAPAPKHWNQLRAEQQAALAPLFKRWEAMSDAQRKKWLGIAQGYPRLTAQEQARLHEKMSLWMTLTPAQRAKTRDNFAAIKGKTTQATSESATRWQVYSALPANEIQKLKEKAKYQQSYGDKALPARVVVAKKVQQQQARLHSIPAPPAHTHQPISRVNGAPKRSAKITASSSPVAAAISANSNATESANSPNGSN